MRERGKSAEETPSCTQLQQNPSEEFERILDKCKNDLAQFYDEKGNALMVRSRTRWHEHEEKITKLVFFLSLETRNHSRKHIRKLCLSGVITTSYERILDSSSKYHRDLYSKKINTVQPDILEHFLGKAGIPKLSEEERLSCEGRIIGDGCVKKLNIFKNGKTPGNDGYLPSFTKCFGALLMNL